MNRLFIFQLVFGMHVFSGVAAPSLRVLWGPVVGHAAHREVTVSWGWSGPFTDSLWRFLEIECEPSIRELRVERVTTSLPHILKLRVGLLEPGRAYRLRARLQGQPVGGEATFHTRPVYGYWSPGPPPDFTFLVGSCFYLNDKPYDRPGTPYGKDSSILSAMASLPADFMIWAGDNIYLREPDWDSRSGMVYRYEHAFRQPLMQRLLATHANYAIWDDHDYGPNDGDRTFALRHEALQLFKDYWNNPPAALSEGISFSFEYADCAFFMLDDRWWRAPNRLPDSSKPFLGEPQLKWLLESLVSSDKPWKFLICGNQVINPTGSKECYRSYSGEFHKFFQKLRALRIEGLVILSGDRHYSELLCDTTLLGYPLYELTCSAVLSTPHDLRSEKEKNNPLRVPGSLVQENNFSRLSVLGPKDSRILRMEHLDRQGQVRWNYEIPLNRLKLRPQSSQHGQ